MYSFVDPTMMERMEHQMRTVPYDVTRHELYNADDLYHGIARGDYYDQRVYTHYILHGKEASCPEEQMARTLHDYCIQKAMRSFLELYSRRHVVGVMGGHGLLRTEPMYRQIVLLSKALTERGFLMVTGGGPGAMEATHLGAWLAGRTAEEVENALSMLKPYPSFREGGWLSSALDVMRLFPQKKIPYKDRMRYRYESLGIPTWLYGHEPSTPFATHIAKYFDNSIREDAVLTVSYGGIIFTPGAAGTMQEIFQDAVQNHYISLGLSSPMIFFGKDFWMHEMPVYPFLEDMIGRGRYKNLLLSITDDNSDIIRRLDEFSANE